MKWGNMRGRGGLNKSGLHIYSVSSDMWVSPLNSSCAPHELTKVVATIGGVRSPTAASESADIRLRLDS